MQIDKTKKLIIDRFFSVSIPSCLNSFASNMVIEKDIEDEVEEVAPDELRTNEIIEIMCEESKPSLQFINKKRLILKK